MICPQCQHDNPDTNRFCGDCGAALIAKPAVAPPEVMSAAANDKPPASTASEPTASHYDPEGYDEADAPKLSHDVIEYDKQIPLIAAPGSDRRQHVPKHILDEVHNFLDEIHEPVTTPLRNDTRGDTRELRQAESTRAQARADAALNERTPDTRRNYIDLDDAREAREQSDRVSGPSFLGLGNTDYEYVYDDQRPSHWRRNFSLLVLIVLAVLAAVQWRSIRDMGLEYAKSGTVKIHVPKRGEPAQPDVNSNATPSSTANNSANGTPNISVAPTVNADAENAKLRAEEEAAKGQQAPQQQNNSAAAGNSSQPNAAAATPPAMPPADTATTDDVSNPRTANSNSSDKNPPNNTRTSARAGNSAPSAMGAPTASASNTPAADEATPPPTRASAAPSASKRSPRIPASAPSRSVPGSFEMQQASALGQTASAVPWLWSALGKGNPDAPVKLADMYLTGHGVEKSCDQGLVILRSAAARGNARASARLGTLYATGICVQQNRVQAYEWMGTAAGRSQSLSSWADAYRQNLWQQMTPEERARVR